MKVEIIANKKKGVVMKMKERYKKFMKYRNRNRRVYFMRQGNSNYYKIGCTTNLEQRLKSIQMYNPIKLKIIADVKGCYKFEKYLHRLYDDYRKRGEWFEIPYDVLMRIHTKSKPLNQQLHK